jgi:hypothetical protein
MRSNRSLYCLLRRSKSLGQYRLYQTQPESSPLPPSIPPPSFGTIRRRLTKWQEEYDGYVADLAAPQRQREKILDQLFPHNPSGARHLPAAETDKNSSEDGVDEQDLLRFTSLGGVDEWVERLFTNPGYLVELS